jgi:hypothetical protein
MEVSESRFGELRGSSECGCVSDDEMGDCFEDVESWLGFGGEGGGGKPE